MASGVMRMLRGTDNNASTTKASAIERNHTGRYSPGDSHHNSPPANATAPTTANVTMRQVLSSLYLNFRVSKTP